MKDELAETERILEEKVQARTEEVVKQKAEIEELYTDVSASIRYAKRLQDSHFPPENLLKYFPSSFVFFKPKDIVSGDFYWIGKQKDELMFAVRLYWPRCSVFHEFSANGLDSAFSEQKLLHQDNVRWFKQIC